MSDRQSFAAEGALPPQLAAPRTAPNEDRPKPCYYKRLCPCKNYETRTCVENPAEYQDDGALKPNPFADRFRYGGSTQKSEGKRQERARVRKLCHACYNRLKADRGAFEAESIVDLAQNDVPAMDAKATVIEELQQAVIRQTIVKETVACDILAKAQTVLFLQELGNQPANLPSESYATAVSMETIREHNPLARLSPAHFVKQLQGIALASDSQVLDGILRRVVKDSIASVEDAIVTFHQIVHFLEDKKSKALDTQYFHGVIRQAHLYRTQMEYQRDRILEALPGGKRDGSIVDYMMMHFEGTAAISKGIGYYVLLIHKLEAELQFHAFADQDGSIGKKESLMANIKVAYDCRNVLSRRLIEAHRP